VNKISPDVIKRISLDVVNIYFNGVRKNQCDSIANEIAYTIESEYDIPTIGDTPAYVNGKKHFVALIKTEYVAGTYTSEHLIIDAALQQFVPDELQNVPDVVLLDVHEYSKYYDGNPVKHIK